MKNIRLKLARVEKSWKNGVIISSSAPAQPFF